MAPFRDGVWEERILDVAPGGVFDRDVDGALIGSAVVGGKQLVNATSAIEPIGDFGADGFNRAELVFECSGFDQGPNQFVG